MVKRYLSINTHTHIYICMNVYDVKYHVYDIKYYRTEPEHIDYIHRFNDKVKPNTILYT